MLDGPEGKGRSSSESFVRKLLSTVFWRERGVEFESLRKVWQIENKGTYLLFLCASGNGVWQGIVIDIRSNDVLDVFYVLGLESPSSRISNIIVYPWEIIYVDGNRFPASLFESDDLVTTEDEAVTTVAAE